MSKLDEKIALYQAEAKKLNLGLSDEYIANIAKSLGPAIYRADTEIVACGDKSELDRIRNNYLKKKLGLEDKSNQELNQQMQNVALEEQAVEFITEKANVKEKKSNFKDIMNPEAK